MVKDTLTANRLKLDLTSHVAPIAQDAVRVFWVMTLEIKIENERN